MQTAEEVLEVVTGFWRSAVLRTFLDLRVADHLEGGMATADSIARTAGADQENVALLLDAACGLGLCEKLDDRYSLTPVARGLVGGRGLAEVSALWLNDFTWAMFGRLTDIVRTGRPVEPLGLDHPFWADTFAEASLNLALRSGGVARSLVSLAHGSSARILDVGCGSGGFGFAFAEADPTLVVTALDSEHVLEVARRNAARLSIADRVRFIPTDLVSAPSLGDEEFDLVVLSNVVHLFGPYDARSLIRKAARALSPGGEVLIADYLPDEERASASLPLLFSVFTRLTSPGMAYTYREIEEWLDAAGFVSTHRADRPGSFSFVVASVGRQQLPDRSPA